MLYVRWMIMVSSWHFVKRRDAQHCAKRENIDLQVTESAMIYCHKDLKWVIQTSSTAGRRSLDIWLSASGQRRFTSANWVCRSGVFPGPKGECGRLRLSLISGNTVHIQLPQARAVLVPRTPRNHRVQPGQASLGAELEFAVYFR